MHAEEISIATYRVILVYFKFTEVKTFSFSIYYFMNISRYSRSLICINWDHNKSKKPKIRIIGLKRKFRKKRNIGLIINWKINSIIMQYVFKLYFISVQKITGLFLIKYLLYLRIETFLSKSFFESFY